MKTYKKIKNLRILRGKYDIKKVHPTLKAVLVPPLLFLLRALSRRNFAQLCSLLCLVICHVRLILN